MGGVRWGIRYALGLRGPEGDVALEALQNNKAYSEAVMAFFEAQKKLTQSGKMTAEILAALQGFHQVPEPQMGEGRN